MVNKEDFKNIVASELRAIRARHDLTQKQLADKVHVDISTITRYENNSVSMKLDILEKILSAYDIDIAIFFNNIYANMQNE